MNVTSAPGNGRPISLDHNSQNRAAPLKIKICWATLLRPIFENVSQNANNHQMSSLGYFNHVKHPAFSHWQLFIFQFLHTFCVNTSLWSRLRLFPTLSQLVCLPLFITLLPPFLKVAMQLHLWSHQPLLILYLCRKWKEISLLHLLGTRDATVWA